MVEYEYQYGEKHSPNLASPMEYRFGEDIAVKGKGRQVPVEFFNQVGELGWELVDYNQLLFKRSVRRRKVIQ